MECPAGNNQDTDTTSGGKNLAWIDGDRLLDISPPASSYMTWIGKVCSKCYLHCSSQAKKLIKKLMLLEILAGLADFAGTEHCFINY